MTMNQHVQTDLAGTCYLAIWWTLSNGTTAVLSRGGWQSICVSDAALLLIVFNKNIDYITFVTLFADRDPSPLLLTSETTELCCVLPPLKLGGRRLYSQGLQHSHSMTPWAPNRGALLMNPLFSAAISQ